MRRDLVLVVESKVYFSVADTWWVSVDKQCQTPGNQQRSGIVNSEKPGQWL